MTALLLDGFTATVQAAYSVRKLRTAYAGLCLRKRRSSDSTTADIGFASGGLDTTALLAFCGSGDGFVSIWYDQSGMGQDLAKTAAGQQPQIVAAGTAFTLPNATARTGLRLIAASSTNMACAVPLAGATAYACISVASRTASGPATYARLALYCGSAADYEMPKAIFIYQDTSSTVTAYHGANLSQAPLGTALAQSASVFTGSAHTMTVDGSSGSAVAAADTLPTGGALIIGEGAGGGAAGGSPCDGAMAEHLIVTGSLSSGDQATIRSSQQGYFGTP